MFQNSSNKKRKTEKSNQVDLLHGPLLWKIFLFAMPLAFSSILQQLFNSCDVAVVGRFVGTQALAAVGANTSIVSLFVNSFVGLAVGANVIIAQCVGRMDRNGIQKAVHTSVLFAIIIGIAIFFAGQIIAEPLLRVTGAPWDVMDQAVLYLRVYLIGIPFAVVYNFAAAILRSIGDTKRPMFCLVAAGILNVGLNLLFVLVFHMGVAGVSLATAISSIFSCILSLYFLCKEQSDIHLDLKRLQIHKGMLINIIRVGGPAAIQSMVFSVSNICLQTGINSMGTAAVAGSAAAIFFEFYDYFMINSFNQAAVTFIGQNYAAGQYKRVKKIAAICMGESAICVSGMIAMFLLGKYLWIGIFTTDPEAMNYAIIRMTIVLTPQVLVCSYELLGSILRGMGKSMLPAVITIIGSVGFRLVWLATVFQHNHTYETIMHVYPISWILTGSMMVIAFVTTLKNPKMFPKNV